MTLTRYLIVMISATLIWWGAFFWVIFKIDPLEAGFLGFLFFYLSLVFALTGTFSLIGFLVRILVLKNELIFRQVALAFRQSISFALLIVGALFLESKDFLTWWNILFLILALTLLEFVFISFKRKV